MHVCFVYIYVDLAIPWPLQADSVDALRVGSAAEEDGAGAAASTCANEHQRAEAR